MRNVTPLSEHELLGDGGGIFVVPDRPPRVYGLSVAPRAPDSLESASGAPRSPSVVLLRGRDTENERREAPLPHRTSWWQDPAPALQSLSCGAFLRVVGETLLLLAAAVGLIAAAAFPFDADSAERRGVALPYVLLAAMALAGYEFAWLAYRVRLGLVLPFKLHEKQTSRELYRQIISYSVDLHTCAITPFAERFLRGSKVFAAVLVAIPPTGLAVGLCFVPGATHMPVGYTALGVFLGVLSAALAPNAPTAVGVLVRYAYFFLSSLNVVLRNSLETDSDSDSDSDTRVAMDKYLAVVVESYSLLLLGVCVLLVTRVVTSKEPMESVVMLALDVASLLYMSAAAAVLELFTQSSSVRASGALAGFFAIVWSSELGGFLTEQLLKTTRSRCVHPLAGRVSSHQNVEKLLGAMVFAVAAAFAAAEFVEFDMSAGFVALLSVGAVSVAHLGKLFLDSLKKVATVSHTGGYLRVGGGVLDRLDTLLFMAVVFAPFFQRSVYNQPQW